MRFQSKASAFNHNWNRLHVKVYWILLENNALDCVKTKLWLEFHWLIPTFHSNRTISFTLTRLQSRFSISASQMWWFKTKVFKFIVHSHETQPDIVMGNRRINVEIRNNIQLKRIYSSVYRTFLTLFIISTHFSLWCQNSHHFHTYTLGLAVVTVAVVNSWVAISSCVYMCVQRTAMVRANADVFWYL